MKCAFQSTRFEAVRMNDEPKFSLRLMRNLGDMNLIISKVRETNFNFQLFVQSELH